MQRQQTEEIWRIKWMLLRKEGNSSGFGNNDINPFLFSEQVY